MNKILEFVRKILGLSIILDKMEENQSESIAIFGSLLSQKNKNLRSIHNLSEVEFKVFSQWGDDGIISWLTNHFDCDDAFFIEFGVQTYRESNTRFLLIDKNWSGLVIDGNEKFINFIKSDSIYWKHDLQAEKLFITKDNIDSFLKEHSPKTDVELLSIDIDGNDYWIFDSLNEIKPKLIICEYNSLFGNEVDVSIPYSPDFHRGSAHYSNLYFGASIQALLRLARSKGYVFVGTNKNGNNAYFLREDVFTDIGKKISEFKIYKAKFRESRDKNGKLTFLDRKQALELIKDMPVVNFKTNSVTKISELNISSH